MISGRHPCFPPAPKVNNKTEQYLARSTVAASFTGAPSILDTSVYRLVRRVVTHPNTGQLSFLGARLCKRGEERGGGGRQGRMRKPANRW